MKNIIYAFISVAMALFIIILLKDFTTVPVHFNINGEPDLYSSKYLLVALSFLPLAISLMMDFLKNIDPKKENYEKFKKYYLYLNILINSFLYAIILMVVLVIKFEYNIVTILNVMMGIFFIIMGNIMPKIKQNYFVGIKTPWALNDNENWEQTHKRGKYIFIIVGIIFIINAIYTTYLVFIILILLILYLYYYSYKISK